MSGNSDSHTELGHVLPFKVYVNVLIALLVLTVLTVVVAKHPMFEFGVLNIVIALVIASIKATVVALFFMHLKYEDAATWIFAAFPILLLATLIAGVFLDSPFRLY